MTEGLDDMFLSIIATCNAVFNSAGRVVWGSLVDKFSFKVIFYFNLKVFYRPTIMESDGFFSRDALFQSRIIEI